MANRPSSGAERPHISTPELNEACEFLKSSILLGDRRISLLISMHNAEVQDISDWLKLSSCILQAQVETVS